MNLKLIKIKNTKIINDDNNKSSNSTIIPHSPEKSKKPDVNPPDIIVNNKKPWE